VHSFILGHCMERSLCIRLSTDNRSGFALALSKGAEDHLAEE